MIRTTWEQRSLILDLYAKDWLVKDIAAHFNFPKSRVSKIIRRAGACNRRVAISDELLAQVAALHAAGLVDCQIAERLGISPARVWCARKRRLRLPKHPVPHEVAMRCYQAQLDRGQPRLPDRLWEKDRFEAFLLGAPVGLTTAQFRVMKAIHDAGTASAGYLQDVLGLCHNSIGKHLRKLCRMGHVVRTDDHGIWKMYRLAKPLTVEEAP